MMLHGGLGWLSVGQLLIAGLAAMLGIQQAAVWRWEGRGSSARQVAFTALSCAAVLVTNAALVIAVQANHPIADLFLARTVALAVMILSILPLAATLGPCRPARPLAYTIAGLVSLRVALVFWTTLIYRHNVVGLPEYGPLSAPAGLATIFALACYVLIIASQRRTNLERGVLVCGVIGSLIIAVFSLPTSSAVLGEVLTGYITLPSLAAATFLVWRRQEHAQRQVVCFAQRQQALGHLSLIALSEPVPEVLDAARAAASSHLPANAVADVCPAITRPTTGSPDEIVPELTAHDQEFARAVINVVAAAQGRQDANDELRRRASCDDLTGLPNRSTIRSHIDRVLDGAHGQGDVAVALCSLNRFKTVNDAYGHDAGDEVLQLVARRLHDAARPCDQIGRLAADEFVVVCTDPSGADSVDSLTERIHGVFAAPFRTETIEIRVTARVGLVLAKQGDANVDAASLLRDAATAAHDAQARAAATGRFHRGLRNATVYRADIEQRLVGAVARGEILVHYQPIVDLRSCTITGFEALARWSRGGRLLPPAEWIPIAESGEVIHEIGEYVLLTAAEQAAHWHAESHPVAISVNVSPRQLAATRLQCAVLAATELIPPESLIIEVTESMAMQDAGQRALHAIRDRGTRIALDDFGTGFSALASVARLPIDTIKIDQQITQRATHADGTALIRATTAIADALNLTVVAEGVETVHHHRLITKLGCDRGQGYLYSPPVDATAATALLLTDHMRVC